MTNNLKKDAPKGLTMELIKFENFKKFKNKTRMKKSIFVITFIINQKSLKSLM